MALVKSNVSTAVSAKVEIETKKPEVKIVKKDKGIYDEAGGFISELIQFDTFVKRQRDNILADEFKLISLSLDSRERDFIFTEVERVFIKNAFEEFASHAKTMMVQGKEKASIEEVIKILLKEENGKEKALALIEEMGNEREEIEIDIEPISFKEAKKILQENVHMLCDMLLLSLKEIARY